VKIIARIQNPLSSQHVPSGLGPVKCCIVKSAAHISTWLSGTQQSGDLSGVLAIHLSMSSETLQLAQLQLLWFPHLAGSSV